MNIDQVKMLCEKKKLRWTQHMVLRLMQRGISTDDVENVILSGEIIEEYPDDYPYPSCLLIGKDEHGRIIHVVCGIHEELWLITAYIPDPLQWTEDKKRRK